MWAVLGVILVTMIIAIIEVPALLKKKWKRDLWVFTILLLAGAGLSAANLANIVIPSPLDWITALYKPLSNAIFNLLR